VYDQLAKVVGRDGNSANKTRSHPPHSFWTPSLCLLLHQPATAKSRARESRRRGRVMPRAIARLDGIPLRAKAPASYARPHSVGQLKLLTGFLPLPVCRVPFLEPNACLHGTSRRSNAQRAREGSRGVARWGLTPPGLGVPPSLCAALPRCALFPAWPSPAAHRAIRDARRFASRAMAIGRKLFSLTNTAVVGFDCVNSRPPKTPLNS